MRFAEGRGVPVNLEDAARWFERAASKGLTPAQFRYASLLEKGQGVKKDLIQARRLYLAAAAKGNGKAMHNLAVLYAEGIDGKPDYGTAAQWFRKAARTGHCRQPVQSRRAVRARPRHREEHRRILQMVRARRRPGRPGIRQEARRSRQPDWTREALAAAQQAVTTFVAEPQPEDATVVPEPSGGWDHAATAPPPQGKPRPAGPLSLGSFEMGKR